MEAASRWLCSFYADKVKVQHSRSAITCGETALLCSIELTNPNSKFKDYHENKITVFNRNKNAVVVEDCEFYITEVNSRQLDVHCYARCAGRATVRLDLGKWYQFEDQDINVDIVPSTPKYLRNVDVCCYQRTMDEEHRPDEMGTLYYGIKSLLKFEVLDEYGNLIKEVRDERDYDVMIAYCDNNVLYSLKWKMRSGTIFAIFLPKLIGVRQMVVHFVDKRSNSMQESIFPYRISINILHPPCSPFLTLKFLDNLEQSCTAGKGLIFEVQIYDIFGNPVLKDSKETCEINVQSPTLKTAVKQHGKEQVNIRKIITRENLSFVVKVCFKIADFRKVRLIVKSGSKSSSKYIYVKVLPSPPDHLFTVRFATNGAIDESFRADPTVMYSDKWSILEARLVDCYDNVVEELSNDYNISLKMFNDKGEEIEMEYKDAEIRNERFRVQVKINQAGKDNLLITLTHKSFPDQEFHLKEIQIQVNDAPLYLAGSKFRHPDTGVAGKEIQLEILPFDVFGCRLPACTSTDYNLTGAISNSISEVNENKETMDFKIIKNESNVVICVAIVLKRAGRRKVIIFDKDNKDQDINVDIVPSSPKYIRNVEVNRFQKPMDEKHRSDEIRALYYGVKSLLEFEVVDEYENFIEQIRDRSSYDVTIEYSDNNVLYRLEWRMRNGTILATFLPKLVGERQMIVRLVDKRLNSMKVSTCAYQMPINILCAPCSPSLTLKFLDDNLEQRCTAGKDFIFQVHFYDIFGNPVHKDSKETCDIVVQAPPPKTEGQQYRKEQVNVKKNVASEDLSFATTVCFETAGLNKVKFTVNSGSKSCSKDIYVKVLPSTPHHLNNVKFTTNGAIDESFSTDPTVMYRNQWSTLEADLVDCYDNVVQELTNDCSISLKMFNDKGEEIEMEYKDAEIRNERFRVQVKINQAGKDNLLITFTHKSFPDQEFHLKEIQIQVNDAPLYLAGSKFRYPDTGMAGKEIQLEILPFDVFGCRLPACTSTDYNLTGAISTSTSEVNENKETMDFKIIKNESNVVICVAIVLKRAGRRKVIIFDKDNKDQEINVDIVSSSPKYIRNMEVSRCQKPMAKKHRSDEMGTLYYGIKSLLKFEVLDNYGNLIEQIRDERFYDVTIEDAGNNVLYPLEWRMRNGTIHATFSPKLVGEGQLTVRLVDKRLNSKKESTCTYQMPINIHFPPCSPSLTLKSLHDNLEKRSSAGKDFIFEVQFYDVFGNPVHKDSKETCEVVVQPPPLKTAVEQHEKEEVNIIKINTTENLRFAVTVCFKIAGLRKVRLIVHSSSKSSSKDVYVKVLPSTPHYLNDVSFTTHGAIDESFSANPTVMYRNQWSILEGKLVDCYDNVVPELSADYNISLKLSNDMGKETQMEYKDAEIRNEQLHVQVMINEAGKHKLSITLTHRNCPDQVFNLKEIQIQFNDAPLYLAGSKFCYSETAVAGKEFQLEILPLDVFGCSLPASSTTDCNLTAELLNPTLELNKDKETVDFKIIKNESNLIISVSIVLTKAGRRKVMIFDKYKKSTEVLIHVNPDRNDVLWELTAPKESAYRRENLILTARLFDRFKNEVRIDVLEDIPDLIKRDGPDGLYCTEKSMEDNKVTIQCHFNRAGKYDLCLADEGGISLEATSFSITVQEASLDYSCSSIIWLPQYDDIGDQPVFPEDESFRCCLKLKDVFGYSHAANIAEDCIKVEYDNKEVKNIKVSSCANEIGSYNIVVPLKNLVKGRQSPKFWCFVNGIKIENPLVLPTFTGFEKYDDDQKCQLHEFLNIVCYGVKKRDIIGNDNINNIKRVCELSGDLKVDELEDSNSALIRLPSEEIEYKLQGDRKIRCPPEEVENKIQKCRNILLHLLRATCYREKAFELDEAREEWKMRASENYRKCKEGECIGKDRPHFCSQIKEKYAALMKGYHDAACKEIFQFFNAERHQSEIDLHGLLVLDEKKLRGYERQLRSRGRLTSDEVNKKIEEERDHGNEAIRKLRERLDQYDMEKAKEEEEPWLEIIVGSGHHSKVRQQIRPKVEEYLGKEELEFSPVNKGALVVTFKPYAGRQPCFGEYYCPKCYRSWRNGRSWVGKWQACYKCHKEKESREECFPLKQHPLRETLSYNPTKGQRSIPHLQELCGKCTELGRPCPRV